MIKEMKRYEKFKGFKIVKKNRIYLKELRIIKRY